MTSRVDETSSAAIEQEQRHVTLLYERLDDLRERATRRRDEVLRQAGGTPQARTLREDVAVKYTQDMARLTAVDHGLCFGRLDLADGDILHIGRIGIFDGEHAPLLIDWRAPAARPFYQATAADPGDVVRRRHIRTRQRTVTGVTDEVLDLTAPRQDWREELTGEAALLAALDAERTGRMSDIVETIQAEQDRIIRAPLDGVLVVQGGPGTGKTAVALHRAAYLLYEHRARLANRGVLIIGPNTTFLQYIGDVLPGLAETDVLLRTIADLYPGVEARRPENETAAAIKGAPRMIEVMRAAVGDRQRVPDKPVTMDTEYGELVLTPDRISTARQAVRAIGKPHNASRPAFDTAIVSLLCDQVAERIGTDPLGGENLLELADLDEVEREIRAEPDVQAVLDWLWPILTPQQLLAGLLGTDARIASAAPDLTEPERAAMLRPPRSGWTFADVPLLDEAAELLGSTEDPGERDRRRRHDEARAAYAQGVLDIVLGSRSIDLEDEDDPEILMATDVLDAALLGERHLDLGYRSTAERAAADRTWSFGHVIVDEAQELSPMAWRMVMRRCASRSMTLVGDLHQTGGAAGGDSWAEVLAPYAPDRWRQEELTVSYRTPAEILAVAAPVLARIDAEATPPRPVRSTGFAPWDITVGRSELLARLTFEVEAELGRLERGRIGVMVPRALLAEATAAVASERVAVLPVADAKGLEFDTAVVVEPDAIVAESRRGLNDLYVALTRATRRLGVLRAE